MQDWMEDARKMPSDRYPNGGGSFRGDAWKFVVHTIEGVKQHAPIYWPRTDTFFGHQGWPHWVADTDKIVQHLPATRGARTLVNKSGGVETNFSNCLQIELMWNAGSISLAPDDLMKNLKRVLDWTSSELELPLDFSAFEENWPRMSFSKWKGLSNDRIWVVGHRHVPENDHWDPGHDMPLEILKGGDYVTKEQYDSLISYLHDVLTAVEDQEARIADLHAYMSNDMKGHITPLIEAIYDYVQEPREGAVSFDAIAANIASRLSP